MHSIVRRVPVLLLLCTAVLAASGIEVLSHKEVASGIEVLCAGSGGVKLEARALVNGDWVVVDDETVASGLAAVTFPKLAAREACLVLRNSSGEVVDRLLYLGGGNWGKP